MGKNTSTDKFFKFFELGMVIFMLIFMVFAFHSPKDKNVNTKPFVKGMTYTGKECNGKFCEKGKLNVRDVGYFDGEFADGRFSGTGKFIFDDGTVYMANFKGKKGIDKVSLKDSNGDNWIKGDGVWIRKASKNEN